MVRFYRRRRVFARRRFARARTSRRIGMRRRFTATRFSRKRQFRPRRIGMRGRPVMTMDRTRNFSGDSQLAQFKEVVYGNIERAMGDFFTGVEIAGNYFEQAGIPDFTEKVNDWANFRVVRSTVVVEFFNVGPSLKDVGILQLPVATAPPAWTGTVTPSEQPRCVFTSVGGATSSASVRKLVGTGTQLTAGGDKIFITSGATQLNTATPTNAPTAAWEFYIYQGTGLAAAGAAETGTGVQFRATIYRTCKFYNRELQTQ